MRRGAGASLDIYRDTDTGTQRALWKEEVVYCGRPNDSDSQRVCLLDEFLCLVLRNALCYDGHTAKLSTENREQRSIVMATLL